MCWRCGGFGDERVSWEMVVLGETVILGYGGFKRVCDFWRNGGFWRVVVFRRWWILKILRFFGRFENFFWKYRNFRRYAGFKGGRLCNFVVFELES